MCVYLLLNRMFDLIDHVTAESDKMYHRCQPIHARLYFVSWTVFPTAAASLREVRGKQVQRSAMHNLEPTGYDLVTLSRLGLPQTRMRAKACFTVSRLASRGRPSLHDPWLDPVHEPGSHMLAGPGARFAGLACVRTA